MKKILSILLSIILIISICPLGVFEFMASATTYSGSCGTNATWEYNTETSTLTISGTGDMSNYSASNYNGLLVTTAPWRKYYGAIKTAIINSGVSTIGTGAFYGCSGIVNLQISETINTIGIQAFSECSGLESITVNNNNFVYSSKGNCLIKIESNELVLGCKNSEIPNDGSVTKIGFQAFISCYGLIDISIPYGVTTLSSQAFDNCRNLKSIKIPNSVTSIEKYAFFNCDKLNTVYYNGTQEQRNLISIGYDNYYLTNAEWIYNCSAEHAGVLQKIEAKGDTLRSVYMKTAIQKKSGAKPTDSSYNLRLISMLDLLSDYSEVGFYITIEGYNDGENDEPIKYSTDTVYTSFLNGSTRIKASDYGAEYFTLVSMTVPNEYYSANIKIKPYIVFTDGTEFLGNEINTSVSNYIK